MIFTGTGLQKKLTEGAPNGGGKRVRVLPAAPPKRDEGNWVHVTGARHKPASVVQLLRDNVLGRGNAHR